MGGLGGYLRKEIPSTARLDFEGRSSTSVGVVMPAPQSTAAELAAVRKERDLYLRLLSLGHQRELGPFLQEALRSIVDVVEVRQGYLELYEDTDVSGGPHWWIAHGFSGDEISQVRAEISGGIIAEALARGELIDTASARDDPRFGERESVRIKQIEAVLCVPIGDDPPRGVLYLQGRTRGGMFSPEDRARAEVFAGHFAPLVDRIVAQVRERETTDATRPYREKLRLDGIIGRSPALAEVLKQVMLAAPLDVTVLLTGETGTGKSQIARIIHDNSPRADKPFIELNCPGVPKEQFEVEIFGARRGAYTGLDRDRDGVLTQAAGGTLFLDEIAEIPLAVQASLLQVLQSGTFRPLAHAAAEPLRANVRIIAATNVDLDEAVSDRRFRDDLRFRLDEFSIRMPSLAERRDDIAELAAYYCEHTSQRHKLPRLELSRSAVRALEAAEWPGNVRELAKCIQKAVIACAGEGGRQVEPVHLFPQKASEEPAAPLTLQEGTRRFQAQLLRDVLSETGWNVSEAARRLDISHAHIHRLLKAFGIQRAAK
jgi:transcriptional regulator with GAF, ATPase, and Fis domain